MSRFLAVASALAFVASVGAAGAAEIRGSIEKVDASARQIVVDGVAYTVPQGMNVATMEPGMQVVVVYDTKNGRRMASRVEKDTTDQNSRPGSNPTPR